MYDIKKVIAHLKIRFPKTRASIDSIEFIEDKTCQTACTDGKKIYYNPEYLGSLSMEEQEFTVCHELLHIHLHHLLRLENRNIEVWNYATDAIINKLLNDNGLPMPEGVIDCPEALSYDAEGYYDYLLEQQDLNETLKQYRSSKKNTHSRWIKGPAKDSNQDNSEEEHVDEREFNSENKKMVNDESKSYVQGVEQQAEKMNIPSLDKTKEIINWRELLSRLKRKVIAGDYDFFNGTFDEEGIYHYPYVVKMTCPVEILIDTSGSVDEEMVRNFLSQCRHILGEIPIDIGCFDTKFYGFQRINTMKDLENFKIEGRGGTDFDVAVNSFTPKSKLRIIFTDGGATMPKQKANIYWFVYSNIKINPPGGKVFYVGEEYTKRGRSI